MTRAVFLIGVLLAAACDVGVVPLTGAGDDGSGSGGDAGGSGGSGIDPSVCQNRGTPGTPHLHTAGGTSNPGQSCVAVGCHLAGQLGTNAPAFDMGGTVYESDGVTPNAGAIIIVTPVGQPSQIAATTDTDGNFELYADTITNSLPAQTVVTACPTVTPMQTQLAAAGGGNCNNCHSKGGSEGAVITLQ